MSLLISCTHSVTWSRDYSSLSSLFSLPRLVKWKEIHYKISSPHLTCANDQVTLENRKKISWTVDAERRVFAEERSCWWLMHTRDFRTSHTDRVLLSVSQSHLYILIRHLTLGTINWCSLSFTQRLPSARSSLSLSLSLSAASLCSFISSTWGQRRRRECWSHKRWPLCSVHFFTWTESNCSSASLSLSSSLPPFSPPPPSLHVINLTYLHILYSIEAILTPLTSLL